MGLNRYNGEGSGCLFWAMALLRVMEAEASSRGRWQQSVPILNIGSRKMRTASKTIGLFSSRVKFAWCFEHIILSTWRAFCCRFRTYKTENGEQWLWHVHNLRDPKHSYSLGSKRKKYSKVETLMKKRAAGNMYRRRRPT